jgi:hypothetical protein
MRKITTYKLICIDTKNLTKSMMEINTLLTEGFEFFRYDANTEEQNRCLSYNWMDMLCVELVKYSDKEDIK